MPSQLFWLAEFLLDRKRWSVLLSKSVLPSNCTVPFHRPPLAPVLVALLQSRSRWCATTCSARHTPARACTPIARRGHCCGTTGGEQSWTKSESTTPTSSASRSVRVLMYSYSDHPASITSFGSWLRECSSARCCAFDIFAHFWGLISFVVAFQVDPVTSVVRFLTTLKCAWEIWQFPLSITLLATLIGSWTGLS